MKRCGEAFVGIDTAKARNAIALAEGGREGEVRYLGEYDNTPDAVAKLVRKLSDRYEAVHFCYEAGPTGYGLNRQIIGLGAPISTSRAEGCVDKIANAEMAKKQRMRLSPQGNHRMSTVRAAVLERRLKVTRDIPLAPDRPAFFTPLSFFKTPKN